MKTKHIPILVGPIVDSIIGSIKERLRQNQEIEPNSAIFDLTLGGGGHTEAFLNALKKEGLNEKVKVVAIDQDADAVANTSKRLEQWISNGALEVHHLRMTELATHLSRSGLGYFKVSSMLGVMADLGFSSDQLESGDRGLSFKREGPIDMRLDPRRGASAYDVLMQQSEKDLADLIFELGEERMSRKIASAIVRARGDKRLPNSTVELADLIFRSVPPDYRHGRIHPATRTFQALRIYVNDELGELKALLGQILPHLRPQGVAAVISFHSLEDRLVKTLFKDRAGPFRSLTKKPIEADEAELNLNPRSRSAKLRLGEKK